MSQEFDYELELPLEFLLGTVLKRVILKSTFIADILFGLRLDKLFL